MNLYLLKTSAITNLVVANHCEEAVEYFNYNSPLTPRVSVIARDIGATTDKGADSLENANFSGCIFERGFKIVDYYPMKIKIGRKHYQEK